MAKNNKHLSELSFNEIKKKRNETLKKIDEINSKIITRESYLSHKKLLGNSEKKLEWDALRKVIHNYEENESQLYKTKELLEKIEGYYQIAGIKNSKQQSILNKASENIDRKRKIASNIKKHLIKNEFCPYCDSHLYENIHADHIYPVAKGGESTVKNMVYVCIDCNSKKSDMTLQQFIKKYDLNRNKIEKNLEEMGKDF
jgi:hypothetical protein